MTGRRNPFEHIDDLAKQQLEQQRQAALAAQQTAYLQGQMAERKMQRDSLHLGTSPESVFGTQDAKVCDDFISYMKRLRLPLANTIRFEHQAPGQAIKFILTKAGVSVQGHPSSEIRGYYVGALDGQPRNGQSYEWKVSEGVYLCEDGLLRYNDEFATELPMTADGQPCAVTTGKFTTSGKRHVDTQDLGYRGVREIYQYDHTFQPASLQETLQAHALAGRMSLGS